MLKPFTFKLFPCLFFEYFVNIFLLLTTLNSLGGTEVMEVLFKDTLPTEAPMVQGVKE